MKEQLQLEEAKLLIAEIEKTDISNNKGLSKIEKYKKRLEVIMINQRDENQAFIKKMVAPCISKLKFTESAEKLVAIDRLITFAKEDISSKYSKISRDQFVLGITERVDAPAKFNQYSLNVCGPAAYCFLWAKFDPLGFTNAALTLYEKGEYTYNGMRVKANEVVFSQEVTPGTNVVDWMILSAIRHSENAIFNYDPKKNSGISAFTSHWEMTDWISKIIGVSEKRDGRPSVEKVNKAIAEEKMVVMLVDWNQMNDNLSKKASKLSNLPESLLNSITGNHYIVIEKPIEKIGNKLEFTIWTWGRYKPIKLDEDKFKEAIKSIFIVGEILY